MNKSSTFLVLILFVLLLAGGAFFFLKPTSRTSENDSTARNNAIEENDSVETQASGKTSVTGNFMELLKLGENYSCDFDYEDDQGNTTKGKVYVSESGDKLRGEFELIQADGTAITTNILRAGEYNYMWTSALPQGFKYAITEEDTSFFGDAGDDSTQTFGLDADLDMDFDCDSWRVDGSMFEVPDDIEFVEASTNTYVDDPCAACDMVPAGTSRDQCLQTLGC